MSDAISTPQTSAAAAPGAPVAPGALDTVDIPALSAQSLIEAGVHFGHSARNWDPRMKRLIFGKRNGIHVINVKETLRGAVRARHFLKQIASAGLDVLIVGTKKQAAEVVRSEAARAEMPYVASRWLGGTLTNHSTIRGRLAHMTKIEADKESGRFDRESKKQQSRLDREYGKIRFNLEGLRHLEKLPAALLVIDAKHEINAIREARKLNIPVVAVVDTDSNPENVDIVIPGNDDSLRGIQILLRFLGDGIIEGRRLHDQGRGLRDKTGLQVSTFDDLGPTEREKRSQGRNDRRGGDRSGARRGDNRTRSSNRDEGAVAAASAEAVQSAEAQGARGPAPTVRSKPRVQVPVVGDAAPQQPAASAE